MKHHIFKALIFGMLLSTPLFPKSNAPAPSLDAHQLTALAKNTERVAVRQELYAQASVLFAKEFFKNGRYDALFNAAVSSFNQKDYRTALRYVHQYLKRNPEDGFSLALIDNIRGDGERGLSAQKKKLLDYALFRVMPFSQFWAIVIGLNVIFWAVFIWLYFKNRRHLPVLNMPAYIFLIFIGMFLIGRATYRLPFDGVVSSVRLYAQPHLTATEATDAVYRVPGQIMDFKIERTEREWIKIRFPNNKTGWINAENADVF